MRVAVGLSGGVDSSVAALLLKEQGHDVTGVTMKLWRPGKYKGGDRAACFGAHEEEDIARTAALAERLGITYQVFDCFEAYDKLVVSYFRDTYLAGLTPNPCVRCNALLKFGLLPQLAREAGCAFDRFATGHYARVAACAGGRFAVRRAKAPTKDQSYFLYRLSQEQLARHLFPLGDLTKDDVRARARAARLETADRPDSQDFYSGDPNELIGEPDRPGDIVDIHGNVLGRHNGYWHYTVGKRKGLGIGGGTPYYVIDLNACRNEVVVGFKDDVTRTSFTVTDLVFGEVPEIPPSGLTCLVKVRSAGHPRGPVTLTPHPSSLVPRPLSLLCSCPAGIAGIAPGQSAVFYSLDSDRILLGGLIAK